MRIDAEPGVFSELFIPAPAELLEQRITEVGIQFNAAGKAVYCMLRGDELETIDFGQDGEDFDGSLAALYPEHPLFASMVDYIFNAIESFNEFEVWPGPNKLSASLRFRT